MTTTHVDRPQDIPQAFATAWAARDAAALAALFVEDADFINVVGIWWEDAEAIERAHAYGLSTFFARSQLTVGRVKTRMLGEAAAVVQARMRLTGQTAPDGTEAGSRSTILTFVCARDEGGWQVVAAQNTDVVPAAETQVAKGGTLTPADYRRPGD